MENNECKALLDYIMDVLIPRFIEAKSEMVKNPDNAFNCGRAEAYYEILDAIKNRIDIYGYNPDDFGLTNKTIIP